ncbi:MAG: hypothetical protein KA214_10200 [Neisseriaceae bacterium]|nr:hypothetical protein [Neisseriaceae bacterium]
MNILNEALIQDIYGMQEALVDVANALRAKAEGKITNPLRTVIDFPEQQASALYMPSADLTAKVACLKAVTIFPQNPAQGKNTTQGVILLTDGSDGRHLALMSATYLTRLRTGALSGLATDALARPDAHVLTVIGTGGMAFEQVLAVLAVRPIDTIFLVNPTEAKAIALKDRLRAFGVAESVAISVERDVAKAVRQAHIISCSTRSDTPVFNGADVQPGTHVNGVGSYLPSMQEVDFSFIQRADKIVVDDHHGATAEAGELIHANAQPDWSYAQLHGELAGLVTQQLAGRERADEITFFKSVGAAYFDLAVAQGVYRQALKLNAGTEVDV